MSHDQLLPISDTLESRVLALNNAHAIELSWLDADQLRVLIRGAFYARRIGEIDAVLLAFDEGMMYDSPNYRWFRALSTVRVRGSCRRGRVRAKARLRSPA